MSTIDPNSHDIATLMVQVSAHEATKLCDIWQETLSEEDQVLLYAEYTAILLSFADRLAAQTMTDAERARLLGLVLQELEVTFSRRENFGTTELERVTFYRNLVHQRLDAYARCPSIMGEGENQIVFTAALSLVDSFLPEARASEKEDLVLETGKSVSTSLLALLTTPSFKALSSAPGMAVEEPQDAVLTAAAQKPHDLAGCESTVAFRFGRWVRRRLMRDP